MMDSGPVHRAICVLVIALATLSGCTPMSPDYPVAQLEFDETLLGEWLPARDPAKPRADPDAKEFSRVVVEPRMVEHNGTRVNPALAINHLDKNKPRPTLKQYRVIVAGEDESGPHRLQFEAYLIKFGQTRLLGLQLEVAEEAGKNVCAPNSLFASCALRGATRSRWRSTPLPSAQSPDRWLDPAGETLGCRGGCGIAPGD
jgi:hypothetical protein